MEHRNLVVLCLICFLYNVGISTTLAPIMAAFQERGCTDRDLEPSCTQPPISDKEATDEGLANAGSFFLMVGASNFGTIAAVGELSDAKGRRCALLIALTGQLLSSITWLFIFSAASLPVFFTLQVGCFLSGGQFAIYGTIFASLADVLTEESVERRTMFFGAMTGILYAGLVVGPLLIGALTTQVALSRSHLSACAYTKPAASTDLSPVKPPYYGCAISQLLALRCRWASRSSTRSA